MKIRMMLAPVVLALLFVLGSFGVQAAVLNVPGAHATIQAAINAAQPGDVIQLASGVYGATENLEPTNIVIVGKRDLTIRGQGRYKTIIRPNKVGSTAVFPVVEGVNGRTVFPAINITGSTNITLDGLQLDCDLIKGVNYRMGILAYNFSGLTLTNCLLQNMSSHNLSTFYDYIMYGGNISAQYNPTNRGALKIYDCEFYNTGRIGLFMRFFVNLDMKNCQFQKSKTITAFGYGMYLNWVSGRIENSTFRSYAAGVPGWGSSAVLVGNFYAWPGSAAWPSIPTCRVDMVNCDISASQMGIYLSGGVYVPGKAVTDVYLTGCDIYDNLERGVLVWDNNANGNAGCGIRVFMDDCRIFDNGDADAALKITTTAGYTAMSPVVVSNSQIFGNTYAIGINGSKAKLGSDMGLRMSKCKVDGLVYCEVTSANAPYSAVNLSGIYWNSANPDLVTKCELLSTGIVATITNLYTDSALTSTRRVRTVHDTKPGAAHLTFVDAVAAAAPNDIIAVFNATAAVTTPVTISSDLTVWTAAGLAISGGGSISINAGVTLTLDGVGITGQAGGTTLDATSAAIVVNNAPGLGADGTTVALNGRVAWAAGSVQVRALYGATDMGSSLTGWDHSVVLSTQTIGTVGGVLSSLTTGSPYFLRLAAVLVSDGGRVSYSNVRQFTPVSEVVSGDLENNGGDLELDVEVAAGQTLTVTVRQGTLTGSAVSSNVSASTVITFANLLDSDGTRFVSVVREEDDDSSTNIFALVRKTYQPDMWYLISMVWDFAAGNTMAGALGAQLGNGLYDGAGFEEADTIYTLDASGNWDQFTWGGLAGWQAGSGADVHATLDPLASFWLKTSAGGGARQAVYAAKARTGSQVTAVPVGWSTLAWPLPYNRTEVQGWGFPRANGASSWTASDLLYIVDTGVFLQMKTDGRWYAIGSSTPSSTVTLTPGMSFLYFNSSAAAFNWTVSE